MHLHRDINGWELIWVIIYPLFSAYKFLYRLIPISVLRLNKSNYKYVQILQGFAIYRSKGPVPLTSGSDIISITFTFVNQFGANLGFRI